MNSRSRKPHSERVQESFSIYQDVPYGNCRQQHVLREQAWLRHCEVRDRKPTYYYNKYQFNGMPRMPSLIEPVMIT